MVNWTIQNLDGVNCNEFTAEGSALLSGMHLVHKIMDQKCSQLNFTLSIAIVASKCIKEFSILQSIMKRLTFDSMLLLLSTPQSVWSSQAVYFTQDSKYIINSLLTLYKTLRWNRICIVYDSSDKSMPFFADYFSYHAKQTHSMLIYRLKLRNNRGFHKGTEKTTAAGGRLWSKSNNSIHKAGSKSYLCLLYYKYGLA